MVVVPKTGRKEIIDELVVATHFLDAIKVRLFVADHDPSATDVAATYTAIEAAYIGYAESGVIVWGPTFFDADNTAITVGDVKQFTAGVLVDTETVYGAFWMKTGELKGAEKFGEPVPIANEFDAVVYTPTFSFGQ